MAIYGHACSTQVTGLIERVKVDPEQVRVRQVCSYLRGLREERGISQQRLSEMAGISRTGLRHIESQKINPTLYSLLKVCKALKVDFAKVLRKACD